MFRTSTSISKRNRSQEKSTKKATQKNTVTIKCKIHKVAVDRSFSQSVFDINFGLQLTH